MERTSKYACIDETKNDTVKLVKKKRRVEYRKIYKQAEKISWNSRLPTYVGHYIYILLRNNITSSVHFISL